MLYHTNPVSRLFNIAVRTCSDHCFPLGFDVSYDTKYAQAPTLEALQGELNATKRLVIYGGDSDNTIFDDEGINHCFRAWHDWHHAMGGHDFTLQGEIDTAYAQARDLVKLYGRTSQTVSMIELLFIEVIGHAEYYATTGNFPANQRAFAEALRQCSRYREKATLTTLAY